MSDLQIVDSFLRSYRDGYVALVKEVLLACQTVQNQTSGKIYDIYSRGKKQNGEELKDSAKILEKISPKVNDKSIRDLHDIIGITVVIYYPDDDSDIFNRIARLLDSHSIKSVGEPKRLSTGYYALHGTFRSLKGSHTGLSCEIQIKTVLHDAWSAKMHDLTYKPAGTMDGRLAGLMGAVASQIEGIEQQSLTIRNIISGRQQLETRAFQRYCDGLFNFTGSEVVIQLGSGDQGEKLWQRIEAVRTKARAGEFDADEVQSIIIDIDETADTLPVVKIAWLLMGKLASGLLFGDRSRDIATHADRFLSYAEENPDDTSVTTNILQKVPAMFYVAGDLKRAADYSVRVTVGALNAKHTDADRAAIEFNRLTFLLELEHLKPSRSLSYREGLQAQLLAFLADEQLAENKEARSSVMDTQGLIKIVFGQTSTEVREGIALCTKSVSLAEGFDLNVAETCLEWRLEAGWRRYFDLTDR